MPNTAPPPISSAPLEQNPTIHIDLSQRIRSISPKIIFIFITILLCFGTFIAGYFFGSSSRPQDTITEKKIEATPTTTLPSLTPTVSISDENVLELNIPLYFEFSSISLCENIWLNEDAEEVPIYDKVCYEFHSGGEIYKSVNEKTILTNEDVTQEDKKRVGEVVTAMYTELQTEPFRSWLTQPKIPVTGGSGSGEWIVTNAETKSSAITMPQALTTSYDWARDYGPIGTRLKEMGETLKQYIPTVTTPYGR